MDRTSDTDQLPPYPGARSGRCPYDPPAEHAAWLHAPGLQRARLHNGALVWVVSRHQDVRATLSDPRISADSRNPNLPGDTGNTYGFHPFPRTDDPEHSRLRRTLTGNFTIRRIANIRPNIEDVVNQFLDEMISQGQPADLVREYAFPIPSLMICLLLGVPYEDRNLFQKNIVTVFRENASPEQKEAASRTLFEYLHKLLERKETEPADDIISQQAEWVGRGEITRAEAALNCVVVLVGGYETVANAIAMSALVLLQHPDQAARIRDTEDRAVLANAVDELLRYLTIADNAVVRVATEDITIGGHLVRAGEGLALCLPAANRDAAFFDQPDVFDIARDARGHLAFGHGIHQCLGQSLARAELQVALPALLRRLPGLRLAVPLERLRVVQRHNFGVHELPVAW